MAPVIQSCGCISFLNNNENNKNNDKNSNRNSSDRGPSYLNNSTPKSIPTCPTKVSCVSPTEILYCSGNSLRISELKESSKIISDRGNSTRSSTTDTWWSDEGRGYSCFEYDSYQNRVAFSQRRINPEISIVSYPEWKQLFRLCGGAQVEYQCVCFSHANSSGDHIAAIGKDQIDAKLWIWNLFSTDETMESGDSVIEIEKPIIEINLDNRVSSMCLFNPCNTYEVGVLFADGSAVRVHRVSVILDKVQTNYSDCKPKASCSQIKCQLRNHKQNDELVKKTTERFKTFSWEIENIVMTSSNYGTISLYDGSDGCLLRSIDIGPISASLNSVTISASSSPSWEMGDFVVKMMSTKKYIILGFHSGLIQCRRRNIKQTEDGAFTDDKLARTSKKKLKIMDDDVISEINTESSLVDISCDSSFENFLAVSQNGSFLRFNTRQLDIESNIYEGVEEDDINEESIKIQSTKILSKDNLLLMPRFHQTVLTSFSPLLLAGKSAFTILATAGEDGKVMCWDGIEVNHRNDVEKKCIGCFALESSVSSMATLEGSPILCVGTVNGFFRFVHVARKKGFSDLESDRSLNVPFLDFSLIKKEKLCSSSITSIKCNLKLKRLVVACAEKGMAFVWSTEPHEMKVLGVVKTIDNAQLVSLSWKQEEPSFLLTGSSSGIISCYDTINMRGSSTPVSALWSCSLPNVDSMCGFVQSSKLGDGNYIYVAHENCKGIESFKLPDVHVDSSTSKVISVNKKDEGMTACSCISIDSYSGLLISGGYNGEISIYKIRRNGGLEFYETKAIHSRAVTSIIFSADGMHLYTSSTDGSAFAFNINDIQGYKPLQSTYEYDFLVSDKQFMSSRYDVNQIEKDYDIVSWIERPAELSGDEMRQVKGKQESVKQKMKIALKSLNKLLKDNSECSSLEKLDRSDFIIDVTGREQRQHQHENEVEQLKNDILFKSTKDDIVTSRVRQESWETIQDHACQIYTLSTTCEECAQNLPVTSMSDGNKRFLDIAINIRLSEIKDIRCRNQYANSNGTAWSTFLGDDKLSQSNFIVNSGMLFATDECSEIISQTDDTQKEKQQESDQLETENDDTEESFVEVNKDSSCHLLLYPPLSVRTERQRRIQIVLLKELTRKIAMNFNNRFKMLQQEKESCISQIEEKRGRMNRISKDLQLDPIDFDICNRHEEEDFDRIITTKENEMSCTEFKEEENEVQENTLLDKDEHSSIVSGENSLKMKEMEIIDMKEQKEVWMDELSTQEMTKEQRKEFEEYETKVQDLVNSLEEEKKALDLELKKLRVEVSDLIETFDEKVRTLAVDRFSILKKISIYELHMAYLAKEESIIESSLMEATELSYKKKEVHTKSQDITLISARIREEIDKVKDTLELTTEEDKMMEKSFRKQVQETSEDVLDQETIKLLFQLYRKRDIIDNKGNKKIRQSHTFQNEKLVTERSLLSRASGREASSWLGSRSEYERSRSRGRSMDDFDSYIFGTMKSALLEAQQTSHEPIISENNPFTQNNDDEHNDQTVEVIPLSRDEIPDGFYVSELVWEKVQDLRREKIEKEAKVQTISDELESIKSLLQKYMKHEEKLQEQIRTYDTTISNKCQQQTFGLTNPDILIQLKQGQDEIIEKATSSFGYSNAILIPLELIESMNKSIEEAGCGKIKVLTKTKNFRKKLNFLSWNYRFAVMNESNAKEQYIDWQLLRVNKQLKMIISGTPGESDREKVIRTKHQLAKQEMIHHKKISQIEKGRRKMMKNIMEKKTENETLKEQLEELRENVKIREEMFSSNNEASGSKEKNRMKRLMKRRKLKETIKIQKADIILLKKEVARLRLMTFPSFSHVDNNNIFL